MIKYLCRIVVIAATISTLAVLVCRCGILDDGTVIAKEYIPAETKHSSGMVYNGIFVFPVVQQAERPEQYILWIEHGDFHDRWYVTKEIYDSVEIGQYIER